MILTFCGLNYTMLQVTNATPEEMNAIKTAVTAKVNRFIANKRQDWNGDISLCWYVEGYFYIPAGCWQRIWKLQYPDEQHYRPAYTVQFNNQDLFFNKDITLDDVQDFVSSLNPQFADVSEQIAVLHSIIRCRLSSHNIATGFGKTYLAYLLAQYTKQSLDGKTLLITPRIILVEQGIADFATYMQSIESDRQLKCYGICGGFNNSCSFEDADVYIGDYQSITNMPDDMFAKIRSVICDEGHTAKALSVKACVSKCKNAEIVTAISGTMAYANAADALTIEQFCGPIVNNYSAHQQITKQKLPKIAIQRIIIKHTTGKDLFRQLLQQEQLPLLDKLRAYPPELSAKYRMVEMRYLSSNLHMHNYLLKLCDTITSKNGNVLVLFTNTQPAINLFELANQSGRKAHLIFGMTDKLTRHNIKQQIECETGWILVASTGTMSVGVSINNLQGIITCMTGHSPHVTLQGIGRMLRNHPNKFDTTVCYDVINDCSAIGTKFDISNSKHRLHYYKTEQHPIYPTVYRLDTDY